MKLLKQTRKTRYHFIVQAGADEMGVVRPLGEEMRHGMTIH